MRPPWCLQRWRSPCDGACWGRWYEFCPETQECPPSSGRSLDRTLTFTVADLALDEGLALRCDCWVRILGRAELAALVGRDVRLHLIGLRRELWCPHCGEPPFYGWVITTVQGH